jgi:hypothetical protein
MNAEEIIHKNLTLLIAFGGMPVLLRCFHSIDKDPDAIGAITHLLQLLASEGEIPAIWNVRDFIYFAKILVFANFVEFFVVFCERQRSGHWKGLLAFRTRLELPSPEFKAFRIMRLSYDRWFGFWPTCAVILVSRRNLCKML